MSQMVQEVVPVYRWGILLCVLSVTVAEVFQNRWAIQVEAGPDVAQQVAEQHGFRFLGQIGGLDGYYLLEHHQVSKRSIRPAPHHHNRLQAQPQVKWVEQQRARKRVKRGYLPPPQSHELNFIDPLWPKQWYLHEGADGHFDMNLRAVWERGYTGKGVVITILDDGIERNHTDLKANYDPEASTDLNGRDADPLPRYDSTDENRHGTRCAGEVAAVANNTKCVTGVAFNAKIGGVRMLDGDVTDYVEAESLSLNPQHIDIYSASWGPDDNGKVVDGPAKLATEAFIQGVLKGRRGRGSIFVWASGNGGSQHDSCNCDGYTNSIFTLSISSASEHGIKPWYLEECSSTLASTYSSGDNYHDRKIVTTDLHNDCTNAHTGTSAAAPLAAGMIALALEANPLLTWRDMQYIVLITARPEPLFDGEWTVNGVGRKVSHKYGYGLMDGAAIVDMAEQWTSVPDQHICMSKVIQLDREISGKGMVVDVTADGCEGTPNEIVYLEHVQAKVSLEYSRRGDIQLHLVSPNGTRSTLLQKRKPDYGEGSFQGWPFMSTHYWGERPQGTWTLEVENVGSLLNKGKLIEWQLILYGVNTEPVLLRNPQTNPPALRTEKQKETLQDETKYRTSYYPVGMNSKDDYDSQLKEHNVEEERGGDQLKEQPTRFTNWDQELEFPPSTQQSQVPQEGNGMRDGEREDKAQDFDKKDREACHDECLAQHGCGGPGPEDCITCKHVRLGQQGRCVAECPLTFYEDETGVCNPCQQPCIRCYGPTRGHCLSCQNGLFLLDQSECRTRCPEGYWEDETTKSCRRCQNCATCEGGASVCSSCPPGLRLQGHTCVAASSCPQGQLYENGSCVTECSPHFYLPLHTQDLVCQQCHRSCVRCQGPRSRDCTRCADDKLLLNNTCVAACPIGYFPATDRQCRHCHSKCETCTGSEEWQCISCKKGYTEQNGRCVSCRAGYKEHNGKCVYAQPVPAKCKLHQYRHAKTNSCLDCHESCYECRGPGPSACQSCQNPHKLHKSTRQCLLCCDGQTDTHCCKCDPDRKKCLEDRSAEEEDKLTPSVMHSNKITVRRDPKSPGRTVVQIHFTNPSTGGGMYIGVLVTLCAVAGLLFLLIFGLLQARSHQKLCWGHRYEAVPLFYQNGSEKVLLTKEDFDDEDEVYSA